MLSEYQKTTEPNYLNLLLPGNQNSSRDGKCRLTVWTSVVLSEVRPTSSAQHSYFFTPPAPVGQEEQNRESQDKDSSIHEGKRKEKLAQRLSPQEADTHRQPPSNFYLPQNHLPSVFAADHDIWHGIFLSQFYRLCPLWTFCPLLAYSLWWQCGKKGKFCCCTSTAQQ